MRTLFRAQQQLRRVECEAEMAHGKIDIGEFASTATTIREWPITAPQRELARCRDRLSRECEQLPGKGRSRDRV